MVYANYQAAIDTPYFDFYTDQEDIFGNELQNDKIKKSAPIENYAAFYGEGIPLYDNSLILADENTYFGFLQNLNELKIQFTAETYVTNGITIEFGKFSCKKIEIFKNLNTSPLATHFNSDGFGDSEYITLPEDMGPVNALRIKFSDFFDDAIMTLKGIIVGKHRRITDFFEFNQITEFAPLGDDLPLNQIEASFFIDADIHSEENQKIIYCDDNNVADYIVEEQFVIDSISERENVYKITSQNILSRIADSDAEYAYTLFDSPVEDWNEIQVIASDTLLAMASLDFEPEYIYPEWFENYMLSPFLEPTKGRKILQQIAWACCCGIRTDKKTNTVEFVPLLSESEVVPDVIVANEDERIIKTEVTKGENYKKIIWEFTEYEKNDTEETLGKIKAIKSSLGDYEWRLTASTPIYFTGFKNVDGWLVDYETPYTVSGRIVLDSEGRKEQTVLGYKYSKITRQVEIDLPSNSKKTLTISGQTLYPLDPTQKIAQLKKWYTNNNTLLATIVDEGDIEVGKIIKIQLRNGNFFTGVVTKLERNSVSNYHTINVEAHQWD